MSAAEEIRQAAERVRSLAGAATPGPWFAEDPRWSGFFHNGDETIGTTYPTESMDSRHGTDAAYIATVHPGVGLALADWLEHEASHYDMDDTTRSAALAIARQINGAAS